MLIDSTVDEIHKHLDSLYLDAGEKAKDGMDCFYAVYYSGAGKLLQDENKVQKQVGYPVTGDDVEDNDEFIKI